MLGPSTLGIPKVLLEQDPGEQIRLDTFNIHPQDFEAMASAAAKGGQAPVPLFEEKVTHSQDKLMMVMRGVARIAPRIVFETPLGHTNVHGTYTSGFEYVRSEGEVVGGAVCSREVIARVTPRKWPRLLRALGKPTLKVSIFNANSGEPGNLEHF